MPQIPRAKRTLKAKIVDRLMSSPQVVFLRKDFDDLGNYDQVGRALRDLIAEGHLARIGLGLYAKLRPSTIDPHKRVLATTGGFKAVSREALDRLNIPWRPSAAEEAYNKGLSTQIPANTPVIVGTRTSRKIAFGPFHLEYQIRKFK